jgi:hypothetical protein
MGMPTAWDLGYFGDQRLQKRGIRRWHVARLGGWTGYASERPPGPITFTRGLQRFQAIARLLPCTTHSQVSQNVCQR